MRLSDGPSLAFCQIGMDRRIGLNLGPGIRSSRRHCRSGYPRALARRLSQPNPISPNASRSQVDNSGVTYSRLRLSELQISTQFPAGSTL